MREGAWQTIVCMWAPARLGEDKKVGKRSFPMVLRRRFGFALRLAGTPRLGGQMRRAGCIATILSECAQPAWVCVNYPTRLFTSGGCLGMPGASRHKHVSYLVSMLGHARCGAWQVNNVHELTRIVCLTFCQGSMPSHAQCKKLGEVPSLRNLPFRATSQQSHH